MAEDRRIALASLAVAAVVGIGAPFATVVVTNNHDSQRLHQEEVQSDRAELRRVLDDAATALYLLEDQFQIKPLSFTGTVADPSGPEGAVRRLPALRKQVDGLVRSYSRVAIRLGRQAAAAQAMEGLLLDANVALFNLVALHRLPSSSSRPRSLATASYRRAVSIYVERVYRFVYAAHRIAGSTTD